MISPLWWIPVTVGVVGVVPLYRGTRRLDAELAALRAAILRLEAIRPALHDVTVQIRATRRAVEDLDRQYTGPA